MGARRVGFASGVASSPTLFSFRESIDLFGFKCYDKIERDIQCHLFVVIAIGPETE